MAHDVEKDQKPRQDVSKEVLDNVAERSERLFFESQVALAKTRLVNYDGKTVGKRLAQLSIEIDEKIEIIRERLDDEKKPE